MFDNIDRQPSYGMLLFSRVSGGNTNLFGSSVQHNQKICLTLKHGEVARELHNDWYRGRDTLFEVEMSYTQFAELITAMNVGDGVPVTIRYIQGQGEQPPIQIVDKRAQFLAEFEKKNEESSQQVRNLIAQLKSIFETKKTLGAKDKESILNQLNYLDNAVSVNRNFALQQFDESMEKIATEAKGEVEAFVENKMTSLALAALAEQNELLDKHGTVIELPELST